MKKKESKRHIPLTFVDIFLCSIFVQGKWITKKNKSTSNHLRSNGLFGDQCGQQIFAKK